MTTIRVPDIGDASNVTVIEVAVAQGDTVADGDTLIVLESDKASMEIPADASGVVGAIHVFEGSEVNEGDAICELDSATVAGSAPVESPTPEAVTVVPATGADPVSQEATISEPVVVPDIGSADGVTVIEVLVSVGDTVSEGDTLVVLESDKASMEIPSPLSGKIAGLSVKNGDSVAQGDAIADVESTGGSATPAISAPQPEEPVVPVVAQSQTIEAPTAETPGFHVHAGPAVRALARQLGVDLTKVLSSGPRGRITKDDLHNFVKAKLSQKEAGSAVRDGTGIPPIPPVDFEAFGIVERIPMTKIHKLTADNMTRCWLNVPAITQFDEADITDLDAFRKSMKAEAEKKGVKLTPLPFLIKASAFALDVLPQVNASIDPATDEIVRKGYIHIGIAVDTPNGLMVPVIRDVDQKGIWEIAAEASELANKAKNMQLKPTEMMGAAFTISSLGSIGGTAFTPIVPTPQAAILGISKASIQPVWDGDAFQPRLMLPLCLSYDHRVINGGDGARFTSVLSKVLADIRHLVL